MENGLFAGARKSDASKFFGISRKLLRHIIGAVAAARVPRGGTRYRRIVEIDLTEITEEEDPSDADNRRDAV